MPTYKEKDKPPVGRVVMITQYDLRIILFLQDFHKNTLYPHFL